MKKQLSTLFVATFILSNSAHSENGHWDVLPKTNQGVHSEFKDYEQQKLFAKLSEIYINYSNAHPECGYPSNPNIYIFPHSHYTLKNPSTSNSYEIKSIKFRIKDFVIEGAASTLPQCGEMSIKCASLQKLFLANSFYCERIHEGDSSDQTLLSEPSYNQYLAYQTIYNHIAMPKAKKNFAKLKQFNPLDAFPAYSDSQNPNPNYEYNGVIYTAFSQFYPDPASPPLYNMPNYNNGAYSGLFIGSAKNLISVCHAMQNDHLSLEDAKIRFNQFLGLPPDSPEVNRKFIVLKLRNNPHISGLADGNFFRPCPNDGNLYNSSCTVSALAIPHHCKKAPTPYDGVTFNSFLENQFYSSYCNTNPNSQSGVISYFPWTGQGFTYDWYPWNIYSKNVQGTSEYVAAINQAPSNPSNPDNIQVIRQKSVEEFISSCDFD